MSQISQSTAPDVTEGYPVTNLTLVVLLLIPCVVILLLLNCLFLGYKFLILSKRNGRQREDKEELLLRVPESVFTPRQDGRRAYMSLSEPVLSHPVTSSRASSRERASRLDQRMRLLRPDGATGSGSLRAPSTIRATSSAAGFSPRLDPTSGSRIYSVRKAGWCKSAPVLVQSSDSEAETRVNLVPPNSPTETEHGGQVGRVGVYDVLTAVSPGVAVHVFDKVEMECEYINPPSEASCLNTSAVGPGLDSDFGASAGVSLRILSADSDGLSNGVLSSALEWDYYDPCYVKQNHLPKHKHHRPLMHTKQYWV
ncbi:protein huluwa isoform X2 [Halichoeres trimaculatus]|uniref:protein huluwa isoform X2 n=1 Tax=Halichoeres trimaculatus TaxID=147232 RepID=UPI003D9DC570